MKIRHHRHSCMTISLARKRVMVDPGNLSDPHIGHTTGITAVIITHQHPDHVDPEVLDDLLLRNPGLRIFAEAQTARRLTKAGRPIEPMNPGDAVTLDNGVEIYAVGGTHAEIHRDLEQIPNVGYVLSAPGEPRIGITGDSLSRQAEWFGIDLLAAPLAAPWSRLQDTIDFLRETKPRRYLPVHDAILSPAGRSIFMNQIKDNADPATKVVDWSDEGTLRVEDDYEGLEF